MTLELCSHLSPTENISCEANEVYSRSASLFHELVLPLQANMFHQMSSSDRDESAYRALGRVVRTLLSFCFTFAYFIQQLPVK